MTALSNDLSTKLQAETPAASIATAASLQVIKRNGNLVNFTPSKISVAVTKAFLAVEGDQSAGSARINDAVHRVTDQVVQAISRRLKAGGKVHIEDIQDQVELALMRAEEQKVARAYVLYREEHTRERALHEPVEAHPTLTVKQAGGRTVPLDLGLMKQQVDNAAFGLDGIDAESLVEESIRNLYHGIDEAEVLSALIMTARPHRARTGLQRRNRPFAAGTVAARKRHRAKTRHLFKPCRSLPAGPEHFH
jgi:ribonucleoside-diphosphate reductase alpha chain